MFDVKLITSFVERAESLHRQRQELDAHLAELYREGRAAHLDAKAIKSLVRDRRHGNCHNDLLKAYWAVARNAPPQETDYSALDAVLDRAASSN